MFPKLSIQSRLSISISLMLAMILILSLVASLTLFKVDERFESVDQKWLASTQKLGELADRLSEFRLAETYRALARDDASRASAEQLADEHRKVVRQIRQEYMNLHGQAGVAEFKAFDRAWNTYLAAHDAWVHNDAGEVDQPAMYGSGLHQLYVSADEAIDSVVDLNTSKAHEDATAVDSSVHQTIVAVIVVCVAALALGLSLQMRVRRGVTRPLTHITKAMHALANGNYDGAIPEQSRHDEIGTLAKAFAVFRANVVALDQAHRATQEAQEQAQALARHDALTGLPNRRLFNAELEQALADANAGEAQFVVMMFDLDRFKPVNDLKGHAVGDLVLCEVARRLKELLPKGDVAARVGGDEFAIIARLDGAAQALESCVELAEQILAAISSPIDLGNGNGNIDIGASIGLALIPQDGADLEALLRAADVAMYRAKRDGRGRYCFFESGMGEELRAQAAREQELRQAVANGTIEPHYQPLIDIQTHRIYGFEMLARWRHSVHGYVRPDVFIPLAEKLGVIGELTWSLLGRACRDALEWDASVSLAVNISPLQLKDPSFSLQLIGILDETGFPPRRLEIEITESALVDDVDSTKLLLASLQQLGIRIALDDFGTGYSSLSHLRDLKFDKVKIDKSFVQAMDHDCESSKIVSAILSLANSLDLPTVAEGIEDALVLERLAKMGCELGQGYYFGKAVAAKEAAALSNEWMLSALPRQAASL
jgi:diguanylate cyclase (GGDEF)-like protein